MRSRNKKLGLLACLTVSAAAAVILAAASTAAQAQFRTNSFSVGSRAPTINPTFRSEPRFQRFNNDRLGEGTGKGKGKGDVTTVDGGDGRPGRHRPPRGYRPPGLGPVVIGTGIATGVAIGAAGAGGSPGAGTPVARNGISIPPPNENRFVKDEVVLEFAGAFPPAGIAQLLSRHRLVLLESQVFTLTNTTIVRARIAGGRAVRNVLRELRNEATLAAGQANFIFGASQDASPLPAPAASAETKPEVTPAVAAAGAVPAVGDPAQYVLGKLHINEAHTMANGDKVLVAVIDSGIDLSHPELAGVVAGSYDALGKAEKPHMHGTAIAGAIAAHARLMGAAPAAKILAIRAFAAAGSSAEATTFAILKGVEYASLQNARIINMSFAGPTDPGLARALAAAKAKGAVLIAASGNFGPKSPPQYPAFDPNVIAVSATDADDKIFRASNIGPHIAVAAPGVDLLLPAPNNDYQVTSGTSFSAAYVSGVAALVLQRAPSLTPDGVRDVLLKTAKDLGAPGKDPEFGAGLVDAYQATMAVQPPSASAAPPSAQ
jgi:subtilisin family serine protease